MALFMPRDENGRLIRNSKADEDLPEHVKFGRDGKRVPTGKRTTLEQAFRDANRTRGFSNKEIDDGWEKYKDDNPFMGKGGIMGGSKRKKTGY